MDDDKFFEKRVEKFSRISNVNDLTVLNLAIVAETLDILEDLQGKESGAMVIRTREGEYKSWDAEIFGVDEAAEGAYITRLKESAHPVVLLSEEAGRVDLTEGKLGDKLYGISDPFDGSWLYKRGLPFMQYSSLALYDSEFNALTSVTGDVFNKDVAFANTNGAFMARLSGDQLESVEKLDEEYRRKRHGEPAAGIADACVESYLLKPAKFMLPLIDEYRPVIDAFKMLHPNGGPYAFAEAAAGQIDVYFARQQPYVDIFSGIQLAQQSGLIITDFDGNNIPKPTEDHETVFDVLVSRTQVLHDQTLAKIAESRKG
jgi:fructose-1,6-bisphosphatase/inositol monophosphatase family enzyme